MEFQLNQELWAMQETARKFAREELRPGDLKQSAAARGKARCFRKFHGQENPFFRNSDRAG